jgi:hypothetical protein
MNIRFVPNQHFHGTATFSFRAWDQTQGVQGESWDFTENLGGKFAFSLKTDTATLTVKAINDKPVLNLGGTINYVHDKPAIVLAPTAVVRDVDSANFSGGRLRVWITDGASTSNRLVLGNGFTVDSSGNVRSINGTIIGKRVSNGFGTKELVIALNAQAHPLMVEDLVRGISFKTVGGAAGKRTINFTVSDGDGGLSSVATKTVNVT